MNRFLDAIDDDSVVLFQYVFGMIFIMAGMYGLFVAGHKPPLTLRGSMGGMDVRIWYWLNIVGPGTVMVGKSLQGRFRYAGLWTQLSGDLMMSLMLLSYIVASLQVESWGKGSYGAFLGMGFFLSAMLTTTHDIRVLLGIERRIRHDVGNS